jgi:hypothetical protein
LSILFLKKLTGAVGAGAWGKHFPQFAAGETVLKNNGKE